MLDILMTATMRPEIIMRTLESFMNKMFCNPHFLRLIVNIDPVGGSNGMTRLDILKEVERHIPIVKSNLPPTASFPEAFKWIVRNSESEYVFLLEDDWELLYPIHLIDMVEIMDDEPDLALLRLPVFKSGLDSMKNWSTFYPWNGKYFECPDEKRIEMGFCGHPSLVRGSFLRECVKYLDTNKNPEKQFHRGPVQLIAEVAKYRYGVYGCLNAPSLIRDIGREWLAKTSWRKKGNKAFFTEWTNDSNERSY